MVIGIFGKSGSGKSTLCKYLEKKGFYIIDADVIGHNILKKGEKGYFAVTEVFGKEFLDDNGEINRKKLGKYVFEEKKADLLSSVTHPIIDKHVYEEIENSKKAYNNIVVDGALLCNTAIKDMCDILILIKSEKCAERITKRDGITAELAESRLASQQIADTADIVIENNGTTDELYAKTDTLLKGMNISYE